MRNVIAIVSVVLCSVLSAACNVCHGNRDCPFGEVCSADGSCIADYIPVCDDGYVVSGSTCIDVNECSRALNICGLDGVCTNTLGGYECGCRDGFDRVGDACVDRDECIDDPCGSQSCINAPGTFCCVDDVALGCNPAPEPDICHPLAIDTPIFPNNPSGVPYSNTGNTVAGFEGVPSEQGAEVWTSENGELVGVGYHNFLPVDARDFLLEADVVVGDNVSDLQFSLWDEAYVAGYKMSFGPSGTDTPYFGLYKVYDDPAKNTSGRPYGDDMAIFCGGGCNDTDEEPDVGDVVSVDSNAAGLPTHGQRFHWRFFKRGPDIAIQIDNHEPIRFTSACFNRTFKLVLGSWASVRLDDLTITEPNNTVID